MTVFSTKMRKLLLAKIVLCLAVVLCHPLPAAAKQTVAAIIVSDLPRFNKGYEAMVAVLHAGGFTEDKLKIFAQRPNADKMSLINSLRRCQSANVDLVVTFGSRATEAAKDELRDIPLLFADVYDPVALGVVKNLAAPGTDATGATSKTDLSQLVGAIQKIRPLTKVGVLYTREERGSEQQLAELRAIAAKGGFDVAAENVRNPKEALEMAGKLAGSCDALYLTESLPVGLQAPAIAGRFGNRCLLFSQIPGLVEAGALIGLEADPDEQGKLVAVQALQVLQGQKAYILPVRPAKKARLTINRQTASQLGVVIPDTIVAGATVLE